MVITKTHKDSNEDDDEESDEEDEEEVNTQEEVRQLRRKRRRLNDEGPTKPRKFYCVFCASNSIGTRVKWMERELAVHRRPCTNYGCKEVLWEMHLDDHMKNDCRFRPFPCPLCSSTIPSFREGDIRAHLEGESHRMRPVNVVDSMIDLEPLHNEGDGVYYHSLYKSSHQQSVREVYMLLQLHSKSEQTRGRIISVRHVI